MAEENETTDKKYKIVLPEKGITLADLTEAYKREIVRLAQPVDNFITPADMRAQAKRLAILTEDSFGVAAAPKEAVRIASLFSEASAIPMEIYTKAEAARLATLIASEAATRESAMFDAMSNALFGATGSANIDASIAEIAWGGGNVANWGLQLPEHITTLGDVLSNFVTPFELSAANIARSALELCILNPLEEMQRSIVASVQPYSDGLRWLAKDFNEAIARQEEKYIHGCQTMDLDPDNLDAYYDDFSIEQFYQEVTAVRWLKETARHRQMQSPAAVAQLQELLRSGQLSVYTLSRFMPLVVGQPFAGENFGYHPIIHLIFKRVIQSKMLHSLRRRLHLSAARGQLLLCELRGVQLHYGALNHPNNFQ